jgi:hypothetical protein
MSTVYRITLLLVATLLIPTYAATQSLTIADCQGFTRATQAVNAKELISVTLTLAEASGMETSGIEVTLTNSITGDVYKSTISGNNAVFSNLPAGAYILGTTSDKSILLVSTSFSQATFGLLASSGAVLGTGGALAGAIIGVSQATEGNNSSEQPTPPPTAQPTPAPTPAPTPVECACDPDATPPSIDDGEFIGVQARLSPSR